MENENRNTTRTGSKSKKKKNRRATLILVAIVAGIFLLGLLTGVLIVRSGDRGSARAQGEFKGEYTIDSYTSYEFDGEGNGALCLGNTTRYVFSYTVDGDEISFDFTDVSIPDISYEFSFDGDKISMSPINSASSEFVLTPVD